MQKFNAGKMSKGTKLPENPFCCRRRPCPCLFADAVVVAAACSVRSKLGNYLSSTGIFLAFLCVRVCVGCELWVAICLLNLCKLNCNTLCSFFLFLVSPKRPT